MSVDKYDAVQFRIDDVWYRWTGYYGCQLESLERRRLPLGTMRRILGHDMAVFSVRRKGLCRHRTTWAVQEAKPLDEHKRRVEALRSDIHGLLP